MRYPALSVWLTSVSLVLLLGCEAPEDTKGIPLEDYLAQPRREESSGAAESGVSEGEALPEHAPPEPVKKAASPVPIEMEVVTPEGVLVTPTSEMLRSSAVFLPCVLRAAIPARTRHG